MPKINILPKSVAELIAAGEVVERPASAVKELVENSIDAGASFITVEIRNGGVKYIRVTDNGCGIHRSDVRTAFISHATSKISTGADLDAIFTLGFRGEALPSIAAVSRLSMLTKTEDEDIGTGIDIEGGEEVSFDDAGCPDGTTVIIKDLFYNTPARMKFLKKDVTEGTYVSDTVSKIALSHPEIRFSLIRDGKQVISTPGDGKLLSAVYSIFGKDVSEALIPLEYEYKTIKIKGYISKPLNNRPNRNLQYCFVNGRYVRIPVAAAALDEAYKNRIMVGKFPMCFLFIDIPAGKIDVNVHPAKTEIRFSEDTSVFETVFYAARSALNYGDTAVPQVKLKDKTDITAKKTSEGKQMSFPVTSKSSDAFRYTEHSTEVSTEKETAKKSENVFALSSDGQASDISKNDKGRTENTDSVTVSSYPAVFRDTSSVFLNMTSKEEAERKNQSNPIGLPVLSSSKNIDITASDEPDAVYSEKTDGDTSEKITDTVSKEAENVKEIETSSPEITKKEEDVCEDVSAGGEIYEETEEVQSNIRIIGEIFKTYILVEEDGKLLIIDKHAAHERMIFNKLCESGFSKDSQLLLSPVSVTLSGKEYAAVTENLDVFSSGGFLVEDFGNGTVIVRECPVTLMKEDIASIITEMAGELLKGNMRPVPEKLTWLYHSTACRAAVKAGDELKAEETESFVRRLLSDDSIRYCPHGRPVMYVLTKHEIEKQFGRIQ